MNMTPAITLADQRACVVREIGLRKSAYPKWVASGRLKQEEADRQLACMEAVLVTLDASADLLAALRECMVCMDSLRDYVAEGGSINMIGARDAIRSSDAALDAAHAIVKRAEGK